MSHRFSALLLAVLSVAPHAATIAATSLVQFQAAIAKAGAGDEIVLEDGTYTASAALNLVGLVGTAARPVVVRARTMGGATIAGKTAIVLDRCENVRLEGFRFTFTPLADKGVQVKGSHHVEIASNHFQLSEAPTKTYWLMIDGPLPDGTAPHHVTVSRNAFWNKTQEGCFVVVYGTSSPYSVAKHVTIVGNHFKGHSFAGSNGGEAIRFGDSNRQNDPTDSEIRGNLFEDCKGDVEVVSVKSTRLLVVGNTLRHNQGSIVLRHGDSCRVVGNFLIGNIGGIRIYGDNQSVLGNYLADNTNVKPDGSISSSYATLGIGMGSQEDLANGENTYDRPNGGIVAHNTLVNNTSRGLEVVRIKTEALAPDSIAILDNLVVSSRGPLSAFAAAPSRATIGGNLLFGAAKGDLFAAFSTDPKLVLGTDGLFRPSANGPVVDAAVRADLLPSWYVSDMDGQERTGVFDLGADEVSASPATSRPLQATDVGPRTKTASVGSSAIAPLGAVGPVFCEVLDPLGRAMAVGRASSPSDVAAAFPALPRGRYMYRISGIAASSGAFVKP